MNNKLITEKFNIQNSENDSVLNPSINFQNNVRIKKYNKPIILKSNQILNIEKESFINKPFIVKIKKSPIKTLRYINNDTGRMKHFTPGAQE